MNVSKKNHKDAILHKLIIQTVYVLLLTLFRL